MKKLNFKNSLIAISALALSSSAFSFSPDRNLEIEGKIYPNHVKIVDGEEGKKTCKMTRELYSFVKDNYKKENFDKLNELNKQFYIQYAKIQLRLVEGKVMEDYCRIHSFYYPNISSIFHIQMNGTKYEPFAKWFEQKKDETYEWIEYN